MVTERRASPLSPNRAIHCLTNLRNQQSTKRQLHRSTKKFTRVYHEWRSDRGMDGAMPPAARLWLLLWAESRQGLTSKPVRLTTDLTAPLGLTVEKSGCYRAFERRRPISPTWA